MDPENLTISSSASLAGLLRRRSLLPNLPCFPVKGGGRGHGVIGYREEAVTIHHGGAVKKDNVRAVTCNCNLNRVRAPLKGAGSAA